MMLEVVELFLNFTVTLVVFDLSVLNVESLLFLDDTNDIHMIHLNK